MKLYTITFENFIIQGYELDLDQLDDYVDISHVLKSYRIIRYTYEFNCNNKTLKFGLSNDEKSHTPLERIYRLAGNLPGWNHCLSGPSGAEMKEYCANFLDRYKIAVDRKNVLLRVYDFTDIPSPNISDPDHMTKKHERELIKQHSKQYGYLPPGNIKDESYRDNRPFVSVNSWNSIVETDE